MSVTSITPNITKVFDQTPIRSSELVPIGFTSMSVAIIVVSLRIYTRHFLTRRLWWDDAITVLALLLSVGLSVDVYYAERFGWGHHAADIPTLPSYVSGILVTLFISELLLTFGAGLTKCSVLFYYLRITSGGAHRTLRYASITALVLISIWTITMTIVICVQCVPTSSFWAIPDYSDRAAACKPWAAKLPFFLGQGITNTIGDFVVVLLPMKYILALKLPMRQKSIVVTLFLIGILASIAGLLRIYYVAESFRTADTTWNGTITFQLTTLEINTGVICASIPAIKPLVVALFPRFSSEETKLNPTQARAKSSQSSSQAKSTSMDMAEETV